MDSKDYFDNLLATILILLLTIILFLFSVKNRQSTFVQSKPDIRLYNNTKDYQKPKKELEEATGSEYADILSLYRGLKYQQKYSHANYCLDPHRKKIIILISKIEMAFHDGIIKKSEYNDLSVLCQDFADDQRAIIDEDLKAYSLEMLRLLQR